MNEVSVDVGPIAIRPLFISMVSFILFAYDRTNDSKRDLVLFKCGSADCDSDDQTPGGERNKILGPYRIRFFQMYVTSLFSLL